MNELALSASDDNAETIDEKARDELLRAVLLVDDSVRNKHRLELNMRSARAPFNAQSAAGCVPRKLEEIQCTLTVVDQAESVTSKEIFNWRGNAPTRVEFVCREHAGVLSRTASRNATVGLARHDVD